MIQRVEITEAAAVVVRRLRETRRPLMFHQSGGCRDGSSPMCYPAGEFRLGPEGRLSRRIEACPFYMGAAQFEYWRHTQLIIVVVPGRGGGFSLEAPEGVRFLTGSRDAEGGTQCGRRAAAGGLFWRLVLRQYKGRPQPCRILTLAARRRSR